MSEKHSITLYGHRTSITLEPLFWAQLKSIASECQKPLNALVEEVDKRRKTTLSSALRVFVLQHCLDQLK